MRLVSRQNGKSYVRTCHEERRRHLRIYYALPLKVRRVNGVEGSEFETEVNDVGVGGMCARALREIKPGQEVGFLLEFSLVGTSPRSAPRLSGRGNII